MQDCDLLILGGGESGVGAALLAQKLGMQPFVSDAGKLKTGFKEELIAAKIRFEEGGHHSITSYNGTVVKSPGIPGESAYVQQLKKQGAEVISEIEWASRHSKGKLIAFTGSNGKTTTSMLCYHILQSAQYDVALAGNVGRSMARELALTDHAYWVLEVSSFQLDDIVHFKPQIGAILNISPDHLDRYGNSFERYADAKMRMGLNQDEDDILILPDFDQAIKDGLQRHAIKSRKIFFGNQAPQEGREGAGISKDKSILIQLKNSSTMELYDLALEGTHNAYNSMAATLAARALEVRKETVRDALLNFQNVEHRLESVLSISGVDYVNDSKATNVNSCWYALESINRPIVWIAGGVDKGNDYAPLKELVRGRVKALVCLGKDNDKLISSFKDDIDLIADTSSMMAAVRAAHSIARKGDTVLLSPACASFDLFENYEDRGRQFKDCIRQL